MEKKVGEGPIVQKKGNLMNDYNGIKYEPLHPIKDGTTSKIGLKMQNNGQKET